MDCFGTLLCNFCLRQKQLARMLFSCCSPIIFSGYSSQLLSSLWSLQQTDALEVSDTAKYPSSSPGHQIDTLQVRVLRQIVVAVVSPPVP